MMNQDQSQSTGSPVMQNEEDQEVEVAALALKRLLSRVKSAKVMLQEEDERVEADRRREEKTQEETTYEEAGLSDPSEYYGDVNIDDDKEAKHEQATEELLRVPMTPRPPPELVGLLANCRLGSSVNPDAFGFSNETKTQDSSPKQ
ncbi:Hypothetical Protein FCC1311_051102 [Hondaea fermentalgiana]|uniref:Uncharacterized protein n=1 Tax=Hondaea fermentalgiana TaxID=2315210 RepID=A0A2R5GEZ5_9STRA|nr:Hypothetical Protein FCC1311_051102 [Hondaea fermentalgiana]|eukprot:GBG28889.1 Hypothetical Protein FCC1311_051102 [Hondaea fermentalgiana]